MTVDIIEAEPGQPLAEFCAELCALSHRQKMSRQGSFNGTVIQANPGSTTQALICQWQYKRDLQQ